MYMPPEKLDMVLVTPTRIDKGKFSSLVLKVTSVCITKPVTNIRVISICSGEQKKK